MTDAVASATTPLTLPALSERMAEELARLDTELGEIDLLIAQAKTEADRHETRRTAASEKLTSATAAATSSGSTLDPTLATDLNAQLVLVTQRAALMVSQVDVLEGKRRALGRFRDALALYNESVSAYRDVAPPMKSGKAALPKLADPSGVPPAVSRLLLDAQEDLRREIARAMHDGPAQSLTNIVLQAQIVERLVATDPAKAGNEVRQLIAMVQQTLEATKSFIFDVRPMVLDDLGLVPTLRRAARESGRLRNLWPPDRRDSNRPRRGWRRTAILPPDSAVPGRPGQHRERTIVRARGQPTPRWSR
jgi:two-component system sensor histidine kinase DegS